MVHRQGCFEHLINPSFPSSREQGSLNATHREKLPIPAGSLSATFATERAFIIARAQGRQRKDTGKGQQKLHGLGTGDLSVSPASPASCWEVLALSFPSLGLSDPFKVSPL